VDDETFEKERDRLTRENYLARHKTVKKVVTVDAVLQKPIPATDAEKERQLADLRAQGVKAKEDRRVEAERLEEEEKEKGPIRGSIRELRTKFRISLDTLEEFSHVRKHTIVDIEKSKTLEPHHETMISLANGFRLIACARGSKSLSALLVENLLPH
jgi:DNA-binding XRE family transcriptional regulator